MLLFRHALSLTALAALLLPTEAGAVTLSIYGDAQVECPGDASPVPGTFEVDLAWEAGTPTSPGSVGYFGDPATMSEDAATMRLDILRDGLDLSGPFDGYTDIVADVYFTDTGSLMFTTEGMTPYGFDFGFDWLVDTSPPAELPLALPLDGASLVGWLALEDLTATGACTASDFWSNWFVEVDYDDDGRVTFYRDGVNDCAWYQACDVCPFDADDDADGDGICGDVDACPGADDAADADGDGVADGCDACPFDADDDADGDDLCGDVDACPLDAENDGDGDGICGDVDLCPDDATNDADGDGICGASDVCAAGDDTVDTDGDGAADACDACPGDAANDADADGACADEDLCPLDAADDADGDGACADADPCPLDPYDDGDADGMCGDVDPCPLDGENDADGDGICESTDNCDAVSNSDQLDGDADGRGDACESDVDSDGVIDDVDNCPLHPNPSQADADGDYAGDACDADEDADGVPDDLDLCLGTASGPVGLDGCSLEQLCPCDGSWKNAGAYQTCIVRESAELQSEGALTGTARSAAVSAAARSSCGRR